METFICTFYIKFVPVYQCSPITYKSFVRNIFKNKCKLCILNYYYSFLNHITLEQHVQDDLHKCWLGQNTICSKEKGGRKRRKNIHIRKKRTWLDIHSFNLVIKIQNYCFSILKQIILSINHYRTMFNKSISSQMFFFLSNLLINQILKRTSD